MIQRILRFFFLPLFLLLFLSPTRGQEALFTLHFAGKAQSQASDLLYAQLDQLSAQYGFALQSWQATSLYNSADYPEIILAVENGDLWGLKENERDLFVDYFLGEKGRKGASLLVIRLPDNQYFQQDKLLNWPWLSSLIHP
ncbi:MAG: hypothetical protein AAGM67_06985, partial [Bacteroidota bacterium]